MGSQIMSDFTFAEDAATIQQVLVDDDAALRIAGYPQQLLIALRAAGQTTAEILRLPVPVPSPNGEITDDRILARSPATRCAQQCTPIPYG